MADTRVGTQARQKQTLAALLALAAVVVPVAGAVLYLDFFETSGQPSWLLPFVGAAAASDLTGPILLTGALALGVLVLPDGARGPVSRPVIATIVVVAALSQAAGFAVSAVDLVASDRYVVPGGASWQAALWTTFARYAVQAVVCLAVLAYGMRWLDPADRRVSA